MREAAHGVLDDLLYAIGASAEWLTPGQFAERSANAGRFLEERALLVAIFEMALKDWQFANQGAAAAPFSGWDGRNRSLRRQRMREELEEWFGSADTAFGSFLGLCDALGLSAGAVRAAVANGTVMAKRASPVLADRAIDYWQEYRRKHRERLREYNTDYHRARREEMRRSRA